MFPLDAQRKNIDHEFEREFDKHGNEDERDCTGVGVCRADVGSVAHVPREEGGGARARGGGGRGVRKCEISIFDGSGLIFCRSRLGSPDVAMMAKEEKGDSADDNGDPFVKHGDRRAAGPDATIDLLFFHSELTRFDERSKEGVSCRVRAMDRA